MPPLHWIALLPMVLEACSARCRPWWQPTWSMPLPALTRSKTAVEHDVVVDARELQPVVVAARADVVDVQTAEDDVPGRLGVGVVAAVVAVDPVDLAARHLQVVEHEVAHAGEVQPLRRRPR